MIGRLRKKIDVQQVVEEQNSFGEPVQTWINFAANRWVDIDHRSGSESLSAQQTTGRVDFIFRMRFVKGITTKMRVIFDAKEYDIEAVINIDQRNRWTELQCMRIST